MHISQDYRQSPLKALLNTLGVHHKTHTMMTRYGNHGMEDICATQDSGPLDPVPPEHTVPNGDNEPSDEYCEETDTHHALADLLEQFWQLKEQFSTLKSTTLKCTPTAELMQLTDKLQHLTMMLQSHSAPA